MRKILLYLFIGSICATPAFCADGGRSSSSVSRSADASRNASRSADTVTPVSRGGDTVPAVLRSATPVRSNVIERGDTGARSVLGRSVVEPMPGRSATGQRVGVPVRPSGNSDARTIAARATKITVTAESIAKAKEVLEQTAELNKSCQDQYNECMDQFCAVVDANQKRCSCSANLSKYAKVEQAVTDANTELNEVAQRIRYVGLSADEIHAIMTETEAEAALSGQTDTSETRNMLDDIADLIKDPTSTSIYYSSSSSDFGLDMDLDFTANSADIFSLDFLNTSSTNSISNKRGSELYNIAKKRCTTVLNECKNAGATSNQITGNYDLAIDKDCIAYEQGLSKMNDTLVSNVRSANLMLQKARLAVLNNKNQYDAKGCIGALENCMRDDMVCGADYYKCLDPTKRYIDDDGNVVLGQNISKITDFMKEYENTSIEPDSLSGLNAIMNCDSDDSGKCIVKYLLSKIGTGATFKEGGLCRPVLDKCQQYTYVDNVYKPYNDVVINYLQRAMVNVRANQAKIISDYASSCMTDVASCYNQQVSQVNAWSSVASADSIRSVMTGACRNVALTCAYAVFAQDTDKCDADESMCIENISTMFYQSLLCPDNSTYSIEGGIASANGTHNGYVNTHCKCNEGYSVWGGKCVVSCGDNEYRSTTGICTKCADGQNPSSSSGSDPTSCVTSS